MSILHQALLFLFLLQIKHVIVDFVLQTMDQVRGKGIYGEWMGLTHSFEHGMVTLWLAAIFDFKIAFAIAFIDFVTHYHIDWAKMNWGNRDMMNAKFWHHLGYDQFAHQTVYLVLTYLLFMGKVL